MIGSLQVVESFEIIRSQIGTFEAAGSFGMIGLLEVAGSFEIIGSLKQIVSFEAVKSFVMGH